MANIMETNFRNASQVAEEFKSALREYNDYQLSMKGGNERIAVTHLKQAGQLAYAAMEHAYKNYIYRYYQSKFEENLIDRETWQEKQDFLTEIIYFKDTGTYRHAYHKDLMDEFCNIVKAPVANLQLILKESDDGNNDIKHDAEVPDPKKLLPALLEMKKFFSEYILKETDYPDLTISAYEKDSAFLNIRTACNNFSDLYSYVFVSGVGEGYSDEDAATLFSINWDLMIDFDPYSQSQGLYEQYVLLNRHGVASTKLLDATETTSFYRSIEEAHWLFANGIDRKDGSICTTRRDWGRNHGRHLGAMLQNFKSTYIKPIRMFISESVPDEFLEEFIQKCDDAFYNESENIHKGIQVFILGGKERLEGYDAGFIERVNLSDPEILDCIKNGVTNTHYDEEELSLPGITQENALGKDLRNRLKNFSEILYDGVEKEDPVGTQYEYYRGERAIYWNELSNGIDIKRTEYENRTKGQILDILGKQPYSFYEIYYKPGFGGTTLMRRIAWDFHAFYPTLILFRYEKEDENILMQLARKLTKPLLVLIDSNYMNKEEVEAVVSDLRVWNESHLVIYINRIRSNSVSKSASTLFSIPELNERTGEVNRLIEVLKPYVTKRVCLDRLSKLERQPGLIEERSPFFFALTAYDEDFVGIKPYISNFMKVLTDDFRKFLVYLAIADYINKPIDLEYFGNVLHNDNPEAVMRDNTAFSSLVKFDHTFDRQTFCRLKFPAVGAEILRQATNGSSEDNGSDIKFINLTDYIIEFISTSNITEEIPNRNIVDFLVELCITRHEDLDSNKPQFSEMITRIGTGNGVSYVFGNKWSHEGEIAVERIFQALVKTYKNDSHFKAHLARFKSYVQGDYNNALKLIDDAIGIGRENGKVDSRLIHMKAMVYAAKITGRYIPAIREANYANNTDLVNNLLQDLRLDLHEAEKLFEEVRKTQKGVAGHTSDISLCINVIDLGRTLEGKDTALFLAEHYNDWYMDLSDRANVLYDECVEYKEELDPVLDKYEIEKIEEMGDGISTIRNGIDKTIELYQSHLTSASARNRLKIRRQLAKAYEERNDKKDWVAIAELMKENILEEPENESNIRIWFKAILHQKSEDPLETLRQAIQLLNQWISNDDKNLEAHFYRYVLTFIEAIDISTVAEGRLQNYQARMKELAKDRPNKTAMRYWLGEKGSGLERLIHKSSFPLSEPIKAKKLLRRNIGIISRYSSDKHAYIEAYKTDIFFNPSQTEGRISEINKNQMVVFGMGFSLDGPRAYNNSIELYTGEQSRPDIVEKPLRKGEFVTCQVLSTKKENYIDVKIMKYNERGSIHVSELAKPYSSKNRPKVNGPLIDAWTVRKRSISVSGGGNELVWELTMKAPQEGLSYGLGEVFSKIDLRSIPETEPSETESTQEKKTVEAEFAVEESSKQTQQLSPSKNNLKQSDAGKTDAEVQKAVRAEDHSKLVTQTSTDQNISDNKVSEVTDVLVQKEKTEEPKMGRSYPMTSITYEKNKKTLRGVVIVGGIEYSVIIPSFTKKMYDGIKDKKTVSVKLVKAEENKIIARLG